VKTRSSWFPALWVEGEGESAKPNVAKKLMNSGDCNFSGWMLKYTQNDKWGAIFRKISEEGIHLVEEVANRTWWSVDHGNVELDRKGNRHGRVFKCRSGQVFQGKGQV